MQTHWLSEVVLGQPLSQRRNAWVCQKTSSCLCQTPDAADLGEDWEVSGRLIPAPAGRDGHVVGDPADDLRPNPTVHVLHQCNLHLERLRHTAKLRRVLFIG